MATLQDFSLIKTYVGGYKKDYSLDSMVKSFLWTNMGSGANMGSGLNY